MQSKNYHLATLVSVVFKVLAWLWMVAAVVGAANAGTAANDFGANGASQAAVVASILAGGAVLACATAFFGYVLSLLRDIAKNTESRHYTSGSYQLGAAPTPPAGTRITQQVSRYPSR